MGNEGLIVNDGRNRKALDLFSEARGHTRSASNAHSAWIYNDKGVVGRSGRGTLPKPVVCGEATTLDDGRASGEGI